jgi:hypothetical protein
VVVKIWSTKPSPSSIAIVMVPPAQGRLQTC